MAGSGPAMTERCRAVSEVPCVGPRPGASPPRCKRGEGTSAPNLAGHRRNARPICGASTKPNERAALSSAEEANLSVMPASHPLRHARPRGWASTRHWGAEKARGRPVFPRAPRAPDGRVRPGHDGGSVPFPKHRVRPHPTAPLSKRGRDKRANLAGHRRKRAQSCGASKKPNRKSRRLRAADLSVMSALASPSCPPSRRASTRTLVVLKKARSGPCSSSSAESAWMAGSGPAMTERSVPFPKHRVRPHPDLPAIQAGGGTSAPNLAGHRRKRAQSCGASTKPNERAAGLPPASPSVILRRHSLF